MTNLRHLSLRASPLGAMNEDGKLGAVGADTVEATLSCLSLRSLDLSYRIASADLVSLSKNTECFPCPLQ